VLRRGPAPGLQVIGRRFADDVVLQLARQLEQAQP
jgi:Asp-tRNA(Asn)/Glu-tRNA(Gln) amidotransferase A subunit family amidase